jgi:hypothetical protein
MCEYGIAVGQNKTPSPAYYTSIVDAVKFSYAFGVSS